jgi:hypothetical protein
MQGVKYQNLYGASDSFLAMAFSLVLETIEFLRGQKIEAPDWRESLSSLFPATFP